MSKNHNKPLGTLDGLKLKILAEKYNKFILSQYWLVSATTHVICVMYSISAIIKYIKTGTILFSVTRVYYSH